MYQQIIIRNLEKPKEKNVTDDLNWVCNSLGFVSGRDLEEISSKIIEDMLKRVRTIENISSELIADDLSISPARVNHHVRNLIDSGLCYRKKRQIFLRGGSLKSAISELRKDANRIFEDLEFMAEEIDNSLGLKNR